MSEKVESGEDEFDNEVRSCRRGEPASNASANPKLDAGPVIDANSQLNFPLLISSQVTCYTSYISTPSFPSFLPGRLLPSTMRKTEQILYSCSLPLRNKAMLRSGIVDTRRDEAELQLLS